MDIRENQMFQQIGATRVAHTRVSDYPYLIIGGTTKAATTSLFAYLASHPAICAATYKETRFFLDTTYPLPSKYRYRGDVEAYNLLFPPCDETHLRLESTPDYLYCKSACERIAAFLPHAKLLFSLREPISRLISWYRFAKQLGKLEESISFEAYVEQLFNAENTAKEQHLQTLQQGCYALYLRQYFGQFNLGRIHILFYEDIAAQPFKVLAEVCRFAGVDAEFFKDYVFKITNRTETMKNAKLHRKYRDFRFQLRQWTHNKPMIHTPLRIIRQAIEPLYLHLNTQPTKHVSLSEEIRHRLINYYKTDVHELGELIAKPVPWDLYQ